MAKKQELDLTDIEQAKSLAELRAAADKLSVEDRQSKPVQRLVFQVAQRIVNEVVK